MSRRSIFPLACLMVAMSLSVSAEEREKQEAEKKPAKKHQFVRIDRDEAGQPIALETAVVRYKSTGKKPRVTVDLIGAVHVADKSYYDSLNKLFDSYDAVLFELIAAENIKIPKDAKRKPSMHPVSSAQLGMKRMLELEFQLECIDYSKDIMVHADMSPDEFANSMKDRGESFMQLFFRSIGQGLATQAQDPSRSSDLQVFKALFAKDRAMQLKRVMAQQFEDLEGQMSILEGPNGSTIITERNKKALEVLQRELDAGKKRIGIFYGAGHLPDFEERLLNDFEMKRGKERWFAAWSLSTKKPAEKSVENGEKE